MTIKILLIIMTNNIKNKKEIVQNIKNILQKINVPEEGINAIIKNKNNNNTLDLIKYYTSIHDKWLAYLKKEQEEKNKIGKKPTVLMSQPPPPPPPLPPHFIPGSIKKVSKKPKFPKTEGNDFHNKRSTYENLIYEIKEKKKCNIKEEKRKDCSTYTEIKKPDGSIDIDKSKKHCEEQNYCWELTTDSSVPNCYKKKIIENKTNSKNKNNTNNNEISAKKTKIFDEISGVLKIKKFLKEDYKKILTEADSKNGSTINEDIENIKEKYKEIKNITKLFNFIKTDYPKIFEKLNKYMIYDEKIKKLELFLNKGWKIYYPENNTTISSKINALKANINKNIESKTSEELLYFLEKKDKNIYKKFDEYLYSNTIKTKHLLYNFLKSGWKKYFKKTNTDYSKINDCINNILSKYNQNTITEEILENEITTSNGHDFYLKIFREFEKYADTMQYGGKIKNNRSCPKYPAKKYNLNKKMKGFDGNYWIVKERKDKRKYWKKIL